MPSIFEISGDCVPLPLPGGPKRRITKNPPKSSLTSSIFLDYRVRCYPAVMDERAFYRESKTTKPASLLCPFCRTSESYDLQWIVRKKIDRLPGNADERDRAKFKKAESYMVLVTDKVPCKNMRCRRMFDVSGIKTTAFIVDDAKLQ